MKHAFIERFTGYEVITPAEEYNLQLEPDFIPGEQLLFGFLGVRRGQLIFVDLEPKRRKRRKKKKVTNILGFGLAYEEVKKAT